jgi:hypothetical protein
MATRIFISYRREDSAAFAGRVADRLESEFGRDALFMDVDTVRLGADFVKALHDAVAKCDVLLAIIGPKWLDAHDDGNRRLDDQNDYVRIEIAAALQRNIPVIPILFDGATIPKVVQLPEDLEGLARRNALDVRNASFRTDIDKLIRRLKGLRTRRRLVTGLLLMGISVVCMVTAFAVNNNGLGTILFFLSLVIFIAGVYFVTRAHRISKAAG